MKRNLTETEDYILEFDELPQRIFLDTNILQYLQDFGEYIFDHYIESENYFLTTKRSQIGKNTNLYSEIIALREILLGIDRTNVEFALSEIVYEEVIARRDHDFYMWFSEMWNHWQETVGRYEECPFSSESQAKYEMAYRDKALLGNLSGKDRLIVLEGIRLDCNAILTVDKFAISTNRISFITDTICGF